MTDATATNLTAKETDLLNAITIGMDEPGCGWLHEISARIDADWARNEHAVAGVLGSLITKGLVWSEEDHESWTTCYWVGLV